MGSHPFRIRTAVKSDAPAILHLIRGLAEYEHAPEEVENTVEQLEQDGWGETPRFHAFIAEVPTSDGSFEPVSFALTYFAYSTWKGTCLYLEDLYVDPAHRAKGIGLAMIEQCVEFAHENNCQRVMWQALDWNKSAIDFYTGEKIGAIIMKEWLSLRLTKQGINDFRARRGKVNA